MKVRLLFTMVVALVIMSALAGTAAAQGDCGTIEVSLDPTQGQAGTQVTVTATGAYYDNVYQIYWDSPNGELLASGRTNYSGEATDTVTVPTNATPGLHEIIFSSTDSDDYDRDCPADFTVTETQSGGTAPTVQQDAYTQARTTMPSTGFFLLPAAGLVAGGAALLYRRRRQ